VDLLRWGLEISHPAERDLKRLSPEIKHRISIALNGLRETPWRGSIRKLEGMTAGYRLRVGDWRVIFQPDDERRIVVIVAVLHRSKAYRN